MRTTVRAAIREVIAATGSVEDRLVVPPVRRDPSPPDRCRPAAHGHGDVPGRQVHRY